MSEHVIDDDRFNTFCEKVLSSDFPEGMRTVYSAEIVEQKIRAALRGWLVYSVRDLDTAVLRWRAGEEDREPREIAY